MRPNRGTLVLGWTSFSPCIDLVPICSNPDFVWFRLTIYKKAPLLSFLSHVLKYFSETTDLSQFYKDSVTAVPVVGQSKPQSNTL